MSTPIRHTQSLLGYTTKQISNSYRRTMKLTKVIDTIGKIQNATAIRLSTKVNNFNISSNTTICRSIGSHKRKPRNIGRLRPTHGGTKSNRTSVRPANKKPIRIIGNRSTSTNRNTSKPWSPNKRSIRSSSRQQCTFNTKPKNLARLSTIHCRTNNRSINRVTKQTSIFRTRNIKRPRGTTNNITRNTCRRLIRTTTSIRTTTLRPIYGRLIRIITLTNHFTE